MVRRPEPTLANVGKRLVKAPKVYVRDSGLLQPGVEVVPAWDVERIVGQAVVMGSPAQGG